MVIYLISDTGAIKTNDELAAKAAEKVGYKRCTHEEWRKKRREQERQEDREG